MSNDYIIQLLSEMKDNCLKGNLYNDPKRNDKAEALNYAIFLCEYIGTDTRVPGHWLAPRDDQDGWMCSVCKTEEFIPDEVNNPVEVGLKYCSNCGAKMF